MYNSIQAWWAMGFFLLGHATLQAKAALTCFKGTTRLHSQKYNASTHRRVVGPLHSKGPSYDHVKEEESGDTGDDDSPLGSLEFVLENARKRQRVNLQYKLQAAWDSPVLKLEKPYPNLKSSVAITSGDVALILIALCIDAKGFALGYLIAKFTSGPCQEILRPSPSFQIILSPLWPVLWAIGLDQVI